VAAAVEAAFICAMLVNAPVPVLSVLGGIGMMGLLSTVALGAVVIGVRLALRAGRALRPVLSLRGPASRLELLIVVFRLQASHLWLNEHKVSS
jgi:hypothetical protein